MKTLLLSEGYDALTAQQSSGVLMNFVRFEIGDACIKADTLAILGDNTASFHDPNRNTPYGNIVFVGTNSDMRWTRHHDEGATLKLYVEHDDPKISIGNVVLYLDDGSAFSISFNDYRYHKTVTAVNTTAGMRWLLQIYVAMPQLNTRFSFANILEECDTFKTYTDEAHINFAHGEEYDQTIIKNHGPTARLVPVTNRLNNWHGYPFAMRMDDPQYRIRLNGGVVGDNYKYVFNQP